MNNTKKKTKKIIALAVLAAMPIIANAGYMAYYPLEKMKGGTLPDGSINIGDGNGTTNPPDPTDPTDPSGNCEFSNSPTTMIVGMKTANGPFKPGDMLLLYKGNLIGSFGPSGGTPLNGVTPGKQMTDSPTSAEFEICGSNLGSFPTIPFPDGTPPDGGNSSPVTFTDTITSNDCPDARANSMGACYVEGANVSQNLSLQFDDTNGININTSFLSSEDKETIASATTISTSTGKSCTIDRSTSSSIGCYNKTLILESDVGSTITFTIK